MENKKFIAIKLLNYPTFILWSYCFQIYILIRITRTKRQSFFWQLVFIFKSIKSKWLFFFLQWECEHWNRHSIQSNDLKNVKYFVCKVCFCVWLSIWLYISTHNETSVEKIRLLPLRLAIKSFSKWKTLWKYVTSI